MKRLLRNHWFTSLLMITMPFALFYWLSSQMAYGQVQREYTIYAAMPEVTSLAALQTTAAGELRFVRGAIQPLTPDATIGQPGALLIYQERPRAGREVRFGEEFPLVLPAFALVLTDGLVVVDPNQDPALRQISHELHQTASGDRSFTGFQAGDIVSVQGKWQPASGTDAAKLLEANGVFGVEKGALLAEVQAAMQTVSHVQNGLGLLTLVGSLLLIFQFYRQRRLYTPGEASEPWQLPTAEKVTPI